MNRPREFSWPFVSPRTRTMAAEVCCMGFGVPFPDRLEVTRSDQLFAVTYVIDDPATLSNIYATLGELPDLDATQQRAFSDPVYSVCFFAEGRRLIEGTVGTSFVYFGPHEWMDDPSGKMWGLIESSPRRPAERS